MPHSSPPTARSTVQALRALAEPLCERAGLGLVAVELLGSALGGGRVVRFSVDRPGGVTAAECATLSRKLSPALDVADLVDGSYTLEVSSPGMDRPVQREEDFVRFVGCTLRVKTWGMDGRRRLKGALLRCEGGVLHLDLGGEIRTLHVGDVERAHLVLTLEQFERLGEGKHPLDPPSQGETRDQ